MIFASAEGHRYIAVSDGFAPFSGVVIVILIVARESWSSIDVKLTRGEFAARLDALVAQLFMRSRHRASRNSLVLRKQHNAYFYLPIPKLVCYCRLF